MADMDHDTEIQYEFKTITLDEIYYGADGISNFFEDLTQVLKEAEKAGYRDLSFHFDSTMEPYEDFPGNPELVISGIRKQTPSELEKTREYKEIQKVADEKGITPYEANQYLLLKSKGVIND